MKRLFNKELRGKLIIKLKNKYHLVIMNDDTLEKKFSFKLSPMNVFIAVGTSIIILIFGTTYIIAFTPLREYIPGYADVNLQENIRNLMRKVDVLEKDVKTKDVYINNIKKIIQDGDISPETSKNIKSSEITKIEKTNVPVSSPEKPVIKSNTRDELSSTFFFTPLKGIITNSFNLKEKHFGVDIVAPKNQAVKSTLDGIVIFSGWTLESGNIMAIQHDNDIISVYKHNSALLKKEGENVKAGDPIAIIGNSGTLTSGPHLHFELWYNRNPVNPKNIVNFQ